MENKSARDVYSPHICAIYTVLTIGRGAAAGKSPQKKSGTVVKNVIFSRGPTPLAEDEPIGRTI